MTIISTPMTTEALAKALMVMVLDPKIRTYLEQNDPKALEQAERALLLAGEASDLFTHLTTTC